MISVEIMRICIFYRTIYFT